jgi:hypothetical protein
VATEGQNLQKMQEHHHGTPACSWQPTTHCHRPIKSLGIRSYCIGRVARGDEAKHHNRERTSNIAAHSNGTTATSLFAKGCKAHATKADMASSPRSGCMMPYPLRLNRFITLSFAAMPATGKVLLCKKTKHSFFQQVHLRHVSLC